MRYYNENPQVTRWKELYGDLVKKYNKLAEDSNQDVRDYNELVDKIESFNSLPWYKKMFYKFDI